MLPSQKTKSFPIQKTISKDLVLFFNKKPGVLKMTIVVTKKIAPRAVDRNRIKRLLKEAFREFAQLEGEVKIIVQSNISSLKLGDVLKKLESLIVKIK